jgi:hypothetical protein
MHFGELAERSGDARMLGLQGFDHGVVIRALAAASVFHRHLETAEFDHQVMTQEQGVDGGVVVFSEHGGFPVYVWLAFFTYMDEKAETVPSPTNSKLRHIWIGQKPDKTGFRATLARD